MNTVEPIRDMNLVLDLADWLRAKETTGLRDYTLFMTGIHLGRRISDILELKVRDIKSQNHIYLREEKTGKEARVLINEELQEVYKEYLEATDLKDFDYMFGNSKPKRNKKSKKLERAKAISRQRVWQILNEAAEAFEYKDKIGCHTLRKTFGFWLYQETKDAVGIQELLNHKDISVTKRYIGITQDSKDKMVSGLSFKRKRR